MLTCAAPLHLYLANYILSPANRCLRRFDAGMFMDKQVNLRRPVGLVISLTDPKRGIPTVGEQEWEDWDTEFKAIVPRSAEQVAQDFKKIVLTFSSNTANASRFVAVFCEDGTNLSGYAIVTYMHQVLGKPLSEAIKEFAGARDPGIFHAPYLHDLYQRFGKGEAAPSPPAAPSWHQPDASKLVPARGDFALPAMRPGPLPVLQQPAPAAAAPSARSSDGGEGAKSPEKGSSGDKMPAGWTKHWSKTHKRPYYFNKATGKQSWDAPPVAAAGSAYEKSSIIKMGALHILYKHQKSRKPTSWKDPEGLSIKSRSIADAHAMMEKVREELHQESRDTGSSLQDVFGQRARFSFL